MKAILRSTAMLFAGPLLVLLGGLPALLRTGQVDLRAWAWPALLLILTTALLKVRRGTAPAIWAALGSLGMLLLFASMAAGRLPEPSATGWIGLIALLAAGAGVLLPTRPWIGLLLAGLAALSCSCSTERPIEQVKPRKVLAVISGLPLFWREGGGGIEARADAPIITVLRRRFEVRAVDSPLSSALSGVERLLVAQPRAFSPAELVALDKWVRGGGHLFLLADPLLRWPSPLPLGDRRRAPSVSMLAQLLAHWGVDLLPPASSGETRRMLEEGRLLTTMAASGFDVRDRSSCRVEEQGLLARCSVGRGSAVLLADADLIDDRLWLADTTAAPLDARFWSADTPAFVVQELGGGEIGARRWLRSAEDLVTALRWAMLAGIFWAVLGSLLLFVEGGLFACLRLKRNSQPERRKAT